MKHEFNKIPALFNIYLLDQSDESFDRVNAALFDFAESLACEFFDEEDDCFDLILDDINYELIEYIATYSGSDFEYDAREHIIGFLGIDINTPGDCAA